MLDKPIVKALLQIAYEIKKLRLTLLEIEASDLNDDEESDEGKLSYKYNFFRKHTRGLN